MQLSLDNVLVSALFLPCASSFDDPTACGGCQLRELNIPSHTSLFHTSLSQRSLGLSHGGTHYSRRHV